MFSSSNSFVVGVFNKYSKLEVCKETNVKKVCNNNLSQKGEGGAGLLVAVEG
jgi:hypothetical protein